MMFDRVAGTYDSEFTDTPVGRLQRAIVLSYMDKVLGKTPEKKKILELNAGTGEDAIHMASLGHQVIASDLSANMVLKAKEKIDKFGLEDKIDVMQFDMRKIAGQGLKMEFDLVFSNFGGLNCLSPDEIEKLSEDILFVLKPGGRFIAVIMPRFCMWESFYFLFKMKPSEMFRRKTSESVPVKVKGEIINTWYYGPSGLYQLMRRHFRRVALRPVGFLVPPSYLGPAFMKRKNLLKSLGRVDRKLQPVSVLGHFSDHYLIDLERIN